MHSTTGPPLRPCVFGWASPWLNLSWLCLASTGWLNVGIRDLLRFGASRKSLQTKGYKRPPQNQGRAAKTKSLFPSQPDFRSPLRVGQTLPKTTLFDQRRFVTRLVWETIFTVTTPWRVCFAPFCCSARRYWIAGGRLPFSICAKVSGVPDSRNTPLANMSKTGVNEQTRSLLRRLCEDNLCKERRSSFMLCTGDNAAESVAAVSKGQLRQANC